MKYNYPIKYAVMPIIDQDEWYTEMNKLEDDDYTICYIVSKCYLISDLIKYQENGSVIKEHEVVFPYQFIKFNKWKKVIPTYNLIYGYCTNANKVDKVFDSYEEALNYVKIKNNELCEKILINLNYSNDIMERIQQKKYEFNQKLLKYKLLEQQILASTDSIDPIKNKKLNNVLKLKNNKIKSIPCNIYEIIQLFDNDKFVAFNISQEQYDNLMKINSPNNIKFVTENSQFLLIHKIEDDFAKLYIEKDNGVHYIKNNSICFDSQMQKVTKKEFENIDEDTLIFYTTETIEDLLNSYQNYPEIDLNQFQAPVLKKLKCKKNIL